MVNKEGGKQAENRVTGRRAGRHGEGQGREGRRQGRTRREERGVAGGEERGGGERDERRGRRSAEGQEKVRGGLWKAESRGGIARSISSIGRKVRESLVNSLFMKMSFFLSISPSLSLTHTHTHTHPYSFVSTICLDVQRLLLVSSDGSNRVPCHLHLNNPET